ncbi:hypothetical protein K3758_02625 [Sulfitobacter sp. W002]|uniref:hypothetical protein n=1 Tax=Sulfitobacter sp. W002 TaxID=2867024 RepID=UPI0021A60F80|nr:hypothetical protein [Sulfitobacter sp. W002]UWR30444.1 hypothetical protein K3758_02625 [Sulfitobacter sp. W002]
MLTFKANVLEEGRAAEWQSAALLLTFALILAVPGETTTSTAGFRTFVRLGLDDAALSVPIALVALSRMTALYVNGAWRRSPIVRMVGSIVGASIFAMIGMAFVWPAIENGLSVSALSTGGIYFTLAFFDALSAYRSGADVRMVQQLSCRTR